MNDKQKNITYSGNGTVARETESNTTGFFFQADKKRILGEQLGKPVMDMLEPIGILMKLEGDKHLKIYGMDEQLEQQPVATDENWDGTLHKGTIHSEKLITSQPKQEQGEPMAWMDDEEVRVVTSKQKTGMHEGLQKSFLKPLYTKPQPAQKPLTREVIDRDFHGRVDFVRQVEAAHDIRRTYEYTQ